jgi:putative transposase
VDTNGLLLLPYVTAADQQDRDAAEELLVDLKRAQPTLVRVWADQGYAGELVSWAQEQLGVTIEIVKRLGDGFVVQAKRWIVERTLAWMGRCRRLARDFEELEESTEAWMYIAMIRLMLRRLRPKPTRKAPLTI